MKKLTLSVVAIAALLACSSAFCFAVEHVNGYYKKDGTYVQPHYRSSPNSMTWDNYSTKGNTNPFTGEKGHKKDEFGSGFSSPNSTIRDNYSTQGDTNPFTGQKGHKKNEFGSGF